ncbi:energy transducer TonB [Alterisphingorhabdus coralli]|uniref:Energy transducer TonB n=1 Tax=Alterisphingorhabdus coralli TaxID=3071408 RepID=A0AA97I0K0_9SPHN|nr:energy transducer TonB [Parasphingorhabdus sp. SCSIO 66989]WOE75754.1 energy transducer TonB [Parasphingorhabdus sp. SCSIO 66989]
MAKLPARHAQPQTSTRLILIWSQVVHLVTLDNGAVMRQSEAIGLGVAVTGHAILLAVLSLGIASRAGLSVPQQSVAVVLADEVGLVDTSPTPNVEAATSMAPEVGEIEPFAPDEFAEETPDEVPPPEVTKPTTQTQFAAAPKPPPRPVDRSQRRRPDRRQRGSRLGNDFLDGVTDQESLSRSRNAPGAQAGPAVTASLQREITRKLKPRWRAPSGADVEKLVTTVSWSLGRDGRVSGKPRCVNQSGVNASNRPQKALHCERAIKAVLDAQPFDTLPEKFYDSWKSVRYQFDRKL